MNKSLKKTRFAESTLTSLNRQTASQLQVEHFAKQGQATE